MMVSLLELLNFMVLLILSTALHEMAHARIADHFGDDTPRRAGRMTFNPFPHLDPMMSILLPAVLYASHGSVLAAAWTPVNPFRMRNPRVHGMLCALGGPAVNLVLMALATVALGVGLAHGGPDSALVNLAETAVHLNAFLAVFNFLPVPPLDGSAVLEALLPRRFLPQFAALRRYGFLILIGLLLLGVVETMVIPPLRILMTTCGTVAAVIAGVLGG